VLPRSTAEYTTIDCDLPTAAEVAKAIGKLMEAGKASGIRSIPAELLKAGLVVIIRYSG